MNERIKELECQCWEDKAPEWAENVMMVFNIEKFAELIVKECARLCEIEGEDYKYSSTQVRKIWARTTSNHCANRIKRNFGVEE